MFPGEISMNSTLYANNYIYINQLFKINLSKISGIKIHQAEKFFRLF